jgi:hypothetical protein
MMRTAQRLLAALLALSTLLFALPALAGAGDITIFRADEMKSRDSMRAIVYFDSTLYLFTYGENYYTWTRESGELVPHPFDQTSLTRVDGGYTDVRCVVASADGLYALVIANEPTGDENGSTTLGDVTFCPIEFAEDGTASLGEGVALDWDDMTTYYDDYEYSREVRYPFMTGNMFTFFTYGESGESNEVFAYDVETGDCELYEAESDEGALNIQGYCRYGDGKGLIASSDNSGESAPVDFYTIDFETGDVEPAFSLPTSGYSMPTNLLYDEKTDMFYYTMDGELMRMSGLDPSTAESVAAVQINAWSDLPPVLTEDGYFICSDYQTVIARPTDPSARAARKLTVYTGYDQALESAYYSFAAKHADTDVVLNTNYADITEAMMNQSTAVDVYTVQVNSEDYGALFDRGYLAELTGSEVLSGLVSAMYPDIQAAVTKDGQLLALPVQMYAGNAMSYNPEALKALGLTEDDVPGTWKEFFQFLQRLPEMVGDAGIMAFDPYMTQSDMRNTLFYNMLNAYMLYLKNADGVEMAFDTPILKDALAEFEKIDFAALGLPEEYEDDSYTYTENTQSKILFQTYANISCSAYRDQYATPMLISFDEGADPMIEVYLTVAFVNPYSENRDLAIEYLEDVVANLDANFLTSACPDRNDPIPNAYYEESVGYYDEQIASIQAELEKARGREGQLAGTAGSVAGLPGRLPAVRRVGRERGIHRRVPQLRGLLCGERVLRDGRFQFGRVLRSGAAVPRRHDRRGDHA